MGEAKKGLEDDMISISLHWPKHEGPKRQQNGQNNVMPIQLQEQWEVNER